MPESEDGYAVRYLGADAVDAAQLLRKGLVGHFPHGTDINGARFHIFAQFKEAGFAETEPAFAQAAAAVEDLIRGRERVPFPQVPPEKVADGFHHLGDPLHVDIGG